MKTLSESTVHADLARTGPADDGTIGTSYHLSSLSDGTVLHDRWADDPLDTSRGGASHPSEGSAPAPAAPIDHFPLSPSDGSPAFLRAHYATTAFSPDTARTDLFRYARWLPVRRILDGSGGPVTYRSTAYAERLGLANLFVTFSGWWPERGARIPTGTFKENEAYAVYSRMGTAARRQTLVVASAGNTARAFLRVATENDLPLVIVVPEENVPDLWTVGRRGRSTVVVAAGAGSDYSDAIALAGLLTAAPDFLAEGGAKNVARRDGMGTTFLSAAEAMGRVPDHYIQAVGSGTGAIAAWEANIRLLDAGYPAPHRPDAPGKTQLHLAQNAPFQLLVDSWSDRTRTLRPLSEEIAKEQIAAINAKVLANRHPPWSPVGGLFDALTDSDGRMYAVTNDDATAAGARFEEDEGIDLSPASRVACGALETAVATGAIPPDSFVSLNITGGGYLRARAELDTHPLTPDIVVDPASETPESIAATVRAIQLTRPAGAEHAER